MTLQYGPAILGARLALDDGNVPQKMKSARAESRLLKQSFGNLRRGAVSLGSDLVSMALRLGAIAGVGTGIGFVGATREASRFREELARVSTLLGPGQSALDRYGDQVDELAFKFGQTSAVVNEALFQALSASVPEDQVEGFLDTVGKAAVGGFTDLTTAVDGTTNVINAYGLAAGEAQRITDAMFVANKQGKTTFEQLSRSIGNVAPTAAAMGVEVEELFSALAAGTKVGLRTSQVVMALRQAFSAIAKPSSEAEEMARRLGIQFNENSIRAQGLGAFLQELATKTGGSAAQLQALFGSVEAGNVIMTLASKSGLQSFRDAMTEMRSDVSLTEDAYSKASDTFAMKSRRFSVALQRSFRAAGEVIIDEFGGDLDTFEEKAKALEETVREITQSIVKGVRWAAENIEKIITAIVIGKVGGMLLQFSAQMEAAGLLGAMGGMGKGGKVPAAAGGSALTHAGVVGGIGKLFIGAQVAYITGVAAWELGEAIFRGHQADIQKEAERQNPMARLGGLVAGLSNVGGQFGQVGGVDNPWTVLSEIQVALKSGGLFRDPSKLTEQQRALAFQQFSQFTGQSITSAEQLRQVQQVVEASLRRTAPNISLFERIKPLNEGDASNVLRPFVGREGGDIAEDIQAALREAFKEAGAEMATELAQEQRVRAQADFDRVLEVLTLIPDTEATADKMKVAADTMAGAADVIADMKIEIDHKVKDKNPKRKHRGRTVGEAKHLSPRYRMFHLRHGYGATVVRPLEEDVTSGGGF